jgi:hypothetical protein
MAQQILSKEFRRMQKLAGLSEAREEADLTGSDGKFKAGDFVTYNEKIYMVTGIYPNGTMGLVLANPKTLDPKTRKDQHLDVKISDVKKYTGKDEDIPVQSESKINEESSIGLEILNKLRDISQSGKEQIIIDPRNEFEVKVDSFYAKRILTIYNMLSPEQQAKFVDRFEDLGLDTLKSIAGDLWQPFISLKFHQI